MILLIDNYDSFSYNLYQLIGEIDPDIRVIRNDEMTIDEIKSLAPDLLRVYPLVRHNESVILRVIIIEELNADRSAVLIERKTVLLKNELFEAFILSNKVMRTHCGNQRTKLIDNCICM